VICKTLDKLDFSLFDAIGLHYSIKPYDNYYLSKALKRKIALFQGTKFIFLQDEYQKVNQVQNFLYTLGFHLLFTLVHPHKLEIAYPDPRLASMKKMSVLTGYVSDHMLSIAAKPIAERSIDVSYRGRRCEYWLGSLANDKERIATKFLQYAQNKDFILDISLEESARVYGDAWLQLLMRSKAVLGTESGASIWDFEDSIRKKTNQFLGRHKKANFETVYEAVLKPFDGQILYNAISPRIFEAAGTKTVMVLFPGEYNGICQPDTHYIPLEKDFSNIDKVFAQLKDPHYLQSLADRAHKDLIQSGLYSQHHFGKLVCDAVLETIPCRRSLTEDVAMTMEKTIQSQKLRNRFLCVYTEILFIFKQFCQLIGDPKYTFGEKIKVLAKGLHRYFTYMIARIGS
jgi:hypothetical protein